MEPRNYNEHAVHRLFDDALKRASNDIPDRATIDAIMVRAYGQYNVLMQQHDRMAQDMFVEDGADPVTAPNIFGLARKDGVPPHSPANKHSQRPNHPRRIAAGKNAIRERGRRSGSVCSRLGE